MKGFSFTKKKIVNYLLLCITFFFSFIFISWRLITLQYCSGFCHTLTWISHGFTCVPHPNPPWDGEGGMHYFKLTILKNSKVSSKWSKASQLTIEKTLKSRLDTKEIKPVSLKEINPEYSLGGLMLKLKLQYFGHLMWRANSLEKTLMLGKTEGSKRRGDRDDAWMASPTQWTCVPVF